MTATEFLSENLSLIVKIAVGILVLLVARKHVFSYIRARVQKMSTEQEIDHFKLLRNEIAEINQLLISEQKKNQEARKKIVELEETVRQLTYQLKQHESN